MLNLLFWHKIHLENVFASYCSEKHEILSALNAHGSNCVQTTVFSQEGNYSVLKDPIKLRKRKKNRFYSEKQLKNPCLCLKFITWFIKI